MTIQTNPDLMRPSDIARNMRLSPQRIRQLVADGTLPHVRIGRRIYIPAQAWMGWLNEQTEKALSSVAAQDTHS